MRLTAGTAQKNHQGARHAQRQFRPQIFFDQRQRQINAGGYSRRGVNISVTNEDRIGVELDGWKALDHLLTKVPVRRRAPPVEQAGGGQRERAAANRSDPTRRIRRFTQPGQEAGDLFDMYPAVTARD